MPSLSERLKALVAPTLARRRSLSDDDVVAVVNRAAELSLAVEAFQAADKALQATTDHESLLAAGRKLAYARARLLEVDLS